MTAPTPSRSWSPTSNPSTPRATSQPSTGTSPPTRSSASPVSAQAPRRSPSTSTQTSPTLLTSPSSTSKAWDNALANPIDIEFNADGATAFVAALGSSRIGAIDPDTGSVLDVFDVPAGPRSIAYDADRELLYVLSRTEMGIQRLDVSTPSNITARGHSSLFNPEPDDIREGRDFMHSSLLSNNGGLRLRHVPPRRDLRRARVGSRKPQQDRERDQALHHRRPHRQSMS